MWKWFEIRLMPEQHMTDQSSVVERELFNARNPASGNNLNFTERKLLAAIQQKERKGLPVMRADAAILPETRSLEVKLASAGLRPTGAIYRIVDR
jgi:hypothetical protein